MFDIKPGLYHYTSQRLAAAFHVNLNVARRRGVYNLKRSHPTFTLAIISDAVGSVF